MDLKKGDVWFEVATGNQYMIHTVGEYFIIWYSKSTSDQTWIPVMNPVRISELEFRIRDREILRDIPANRILYGKK